MSLAGNVARMGETQMHIKLLLRNLMVLNYSCDIRGKYIIILKRILYK